MFQPPAAGWVSGCVSWMLQSMVQREENSITNKVTVRAWPNSMQSAHFPRGECLAASAVSRSAREVLLETGGKWKMDEPQQQPRCCAQAGTGLWGVFAKGPARHSSGERCECGGARGETRSREMPACFPQDSFTSSCQHCPEGISRAGSRELVPEEQHLPAEGGQ